MNENNGKLLTIKEAAEFTGLRTTTLYKHIKKGKLSVEFRQVQGNAVKVVSKEELVKVYGSPSNAGTMPSSAGEFRNIPEDAIKKEDLKETILEIFQEQQTQLMKPLEELATYRVGKLEAEKQFLEDKVITLLEENEGLKTQIKALPGPVEEVKEKLEILEMEVNTFRKKSEELEKERGDLVARAEEEKKIIQRKDKILMENANNLTLLQKEKKTLEKKTEELEKENNNKEEEFVKAKQNLALHFQKEEENYLATIEELKKRLEKENKPWWKKIF